MVVEREGVRHESEIVHALRRLLRDLAEIRIVNNLDRVQRRRHELVVLPRISPPRPTVFMLLPPQMAGVVSFSRAAASSTLRSRISRSGHAQLIPSLSHTSYSHTHGDFRYRRSTYDGNVRRFPHRAHTVEADSYDSVGSDAIRCDLHFTPHSAPTDASRRGHRGSPPRPRDYRGDSEGRDEDGRARGLGGSARRASRTPSCPSVSTGKPGKRGNLELVDEEGVEVVVAAV